MLNIFLLRKDTAVQGRYLRRSRGEYQSLVLNNLIIAALKSLKA